MQITDDASNKTQTTRQTAVIGLALLLVALPPGCVRRRMTVRSNPPGATVYVDDQQIGTTPVSTPFVYYGTRKIQLVKDGYETQTIQHRVSPPWYQIPPLDFFSENLTPYEFRDERIVELEMEPQRIVSVPELLQRGHELRDASRANRTPAQPAGYAGGQGDFEHPGASVPSRGLPPAYLPPVDTAPGVPPEYVVPQ